jgi:hypothetical protein
MSPAITSLLLPPPKPFDPIGGLTAVAVGSEGIHQLPRGVREF